MENKKDAFRAQSVIDKVRSAEKKARKLELAGQRYNNPGKFIPTETEEEMDRINEIFLEGRAHSYEDETEESTIS